MDKRNRRHSAKLKQTKMKWRTVIKYVDQQTGELLAKKTVNDKYIITQTYHTEIMYTVEKGIQYGTKTITRVCTNEGKQLEIGFS